MRIERASQVIQRLLGRAHPLATAHQRAGDQVAVAVQVLGGAVHYQIKSPPQRLEGERRGEGVVDDGDQPSGTRKRGGRRQVHHAHQRVGHRLDVEGARPRPQRALPGRRIVAGHEGVLDSQAGQIMRDQIVSAAVETVLGEQVIAGAQRGEERRAHRRHAAGGSQRRFRAFQRGELSVQRVVRRRIGEARVADVVIPARSRLLEGAGLVDGHRHRAFRARARLSGVDQQGVGFHGRATYLTPPSQNRFSPRAL